MQLVAGLPVQVRGRAIRPAYEGIETGLRFVPCSREPPRRAIRPAYEGIETNLSAFSFSLVFVWSRDPPRL